MKLSIVLLILVGLILSASTLRADRIASDFTLADLSGKKIKLSDYKGKVVFLNFWATWCPACREEMPSLQALSQKLKGDKFEILAVSLDKADKKVVSRFIKDGNYTFKVLLDPKGETAKKYNIVSIPTTFIIDQKGRIKDKIIGARDWTDAKMLKSLKDLL